MFLAERLLPEDILSRASLRGNEFAWPVADIPDVIRATQSRGLVSVGGQLQFRLPDEGTCECYWVEVRTSYPDPALSRWDDHVQQTATEALVQFAALRERYDFMREGREGFGTHLSEWEIKGVNPQSLMCFVWYVEVEDDEAKLAQ